MRPSLLASRRILSLPLSFRSSLLPPLLPPLLHCRSSFLPLSPSVFLLPSRPHSASPIKNNTTNQQQQQQQQQQPAEEEGTFRVSFAIYLRACYAMSGSCIAYAVWCAVLGE
eukprot:553726-Rhodomonas_salina.1